MQGPDGEQPVLSHDTLDLIATSHASQLGADIWGLGAMLYAPNASGSFVIGHDGQNGPAINTAARIDPATGNGIVILSTGHGSLATELAGEWVFWKTGNVDNLDFARCKHCIGYSGTIGSLYVGKRPELILGHVATDD